MEEQPTLRNGSYSSFEEPELMLALYTGNRLNEKEKKELKKPTAFHKTWAMPLPTSYEFERNALLASASGGWLYGDDEKRLKDLTDLYKTWPQPLPTSYEFERNAMEVIMSGSWLKKEENVVKKPNILMREMKTPETISPSGKGDKKETLRRTWNPSSEYMQRKCKQTTASENWWKTEEEKGKKKPSIWRQLMKYGLKMLSTLQKLWKNESNKFKKEKKTTSISLRTRRKICLE